MYIVHHKLCLTSPTQSREMVDATVSFLLQNLPRLLNDEVKLLSGVEDKINSLCNALKFIDIFLKSSMGMRNDEFVKEVVNQIRDAAYKAEDVVDIYIANITRYRQRNTLCKLFHLKERIMMLHEVDAEIEKIKKSIDDIYKNKERYGIIKGDFKDEQVAAAESLRERRRDVEEKDVVGLVHDSRVVIDKLMKDDSDLKVVCIIGMGGLGKTTLARKIYNSNQVKDLFPCRAWGYVSNDYRPRELLQSLLKCLSIANEADASNDEKVKNKLRECLKGKKYLIVLDDIWKPQVWDKVKGVFPDDKNGSRILITSREKSVAHYTGATSPYNLPFLNQEESWELFSKKVFRGKECPSHLERLGRSIVESCKGLPLAIEVLSGLVAKKEKSEREWLRIKKISWELTEDKFEVMDILRLSYDNLPQRLKPCFLYFAIYPEDYEIRARDVILMWIAEGFIQPHEGGTSSIGAAEAEEIADLYLDELVDRSLVQVVSRRSIDGGVKTCRIHDLLRDLCISESKSDMCLEVCNEVNNIDSLINGNPRRLSFHCEVWSNDSTKASNQLYTRSLFFLANNQNNLPEDALTGFLLARVVYTTAHKYTYLRHVTIRINWKMMIHLRYLNIQGKVKHIPASVSNLWNLETLDVGRVETVSSEIWKLKRLKHLYLRDAKRVALPPKSYGKIKTNLQTLLLETDGYREIVLLLKLDIFPQLKKLYLYHYKDTGPLPSLDYQRNLVSLKIRGSLEPPTDANAFPSNLSKITLTETSFGHDIFSTLGKLPNLRILKLVYSHFPYDNLKFGAGAFPQLQLFEMRGMGITTWTVEKGAMPRLGHLVINDCRFLDELPEELWCLTTPPQVHLLNPSEKLAHSLRDVELKHRSKIIISHAPLLRL
ncbi:hypothetical protein RJT34_18547 [Clitoria ternatea]|uniref:Uncharacterized protein n=1 Tax=Clitoria ternatea TaxID=43366 RepID=A0AAN9JCJ4_CLITE